MLCLIVGGGPWHSHVCRVYYTDEVEIIGNMFESLDRMEDILIRLCIAKN